MSAQTGVETPGGPASRRVGDRVRYRLDVLASQPNPLWMREMRQSARLLRTPIILMALTVLTTLVLASLGGVMTAGGGTSPAEAGSILFHVYFSLAWFVVTLVGPALAANSIASEREGKTWEALLLTGLRPSVVTRGKFLSAYTAIVMYVVALAPVGALPFLFGGVTPVEVLVAFLFLFLIALLSVAFGLAISAKMDSLRGALLVTLLVAMPLSTFCYLALGVGMSVAVHQLWDGVTEGAPVWLPTAYSRAPFGVEYVVYLLLMPTAAVCLPAWLLYEITRSNLTSVTDDRSIGLKRWYLTAATATAITAAVPFFAVSARERAYALMSGMSFLVFFALFNAFLFGGEPIGPSRRVKEMLAGAGTLRRLLTPGVMRAALMQLGVGLFWLIAIAAMGVGFLRFDGGPFAEDQSAQIVTFTAYAVGLCTFVVGLAAFLRARSVSTAVPRVLLLVVLFFLFTGPWILAAITGVFAGSGNQFGPALAVAAPSPFYIVIAVESITAPDPGVAVFAAMVAAAGYAAGGFALLVAANVRCRRIIDDHERILAEADRRLAEEDRLAKEAREARAQESLADLEAVPADEAPATDPSATAAPADPAAPAAGAPAPEPADEAPEPAATPAPAAAPSDDQPPS
jgi:ABC-type transport system involved in multi-copper enzyme maturation permease subunit